MKKILRYITQEEADVGIRLNSLLATYKSLMEIDKYNIDKKALVCRINECQQEINNYWDGLLLKYDLPYYADHAMKIGYDNPSIYINE